MVRLVLALKISIKERRSNCVGFVYELELGLGLKLAFGHVLGLRLG